MTRKLKPLKCTGCKAFEYGSFPCRCRLGFEITKDSDFEDYRPKNLMPRCPKPKNYSDLIYWLNFYVLDRVMTRKQ